MRIFKSGKYKSAKRQNQIYERWVKVWYWLAWFWLVQVFAIGWFGISWFILIYPDLS